MNAESIFALQPIQAGGLSAVLRPQRAGDADFLLRLYCSVRSREFAAAGWPEPMLAQFLAQQFRLQSMQYESNYPGIEQWIVELDRREVGRFYLWPAPAELRIVDLSLLPEARGKGIGSALIESAARRAAASGLPLRLSVAKDNPALGLYLRLGFVIVAEQEIYVQMERSRS